MVFPDRPTGNAWQLIGNSFNQGAGIVNDLATSQNAMQALVERRTQAALEQKRLEREQAARDWELQQKKDDDAKQEKARAVVSYLWENGVNNEAVKSVIPASTRDIGIPSSDVAMQPPASIGGTAAPQLGYRPTQIPQIQTPEQTVTTPGESRPATIADYQQAILPTVDPATFVKNLTPPNKAAAISAARQYILTAKASGNAVIKGSDLDQAALAGDPSGAILLDKDYNTFKKAYATDVQAQNSTTQQANATTAQKRAGISQQMADQYAKRTSQNQQINTANPENIKMLAEDLADGSLRIDKLPFLLGRSDKNSGARLQAYQMAKQINPSFDPSEYEKEFKAYENNGNQKALAQIAAVRPNIDTMIKMSNDVPRLGMPAINSLIMKGKYVIGDTPVTTLEEMRQALADELGTALSRSGNFSDAKLALARDLLHTDISEANFASNMELLKHMLDNNEKSIKAPMGHYAQPKGDAIKSSSGKTSVTFH